MARSKASVQERHGWRGQPIPACLARVIEQFAAGDPIKFPDGGASIFISAGARCFLERLQSQDEPDIRAVWPSLGAVCNPPASFDSGAKHLLSAAKHLLLNAVSALDDVSNGPHVAAAEARRRTTAVQKAARKLAKALSVDNQWSSMSIGELWDYYNEMFWRSIQGEESDWVFGTVLINTPTMLHLVERLEIYTQKWLGGASRATKPNRVGAKITQFREKIFTYLVAHYGVDAPNEIATIAHGITLAAYYDTSTDSDLVSHDAARMHLRRLVQPRT